MKLAATEFHASDNGEFLDFGFYDHDKLYGFGFTRLHGEHRIELMVADQSVYDLEQAEIWFATEGFEIRLPPGTINKRDGDDHYTISYDEMSEEVFEKGLHLLRQIVEGHPKIRLLHP